MAALQGSLLPALVAIRQNLRKPLDGQPQCITLCIILGAHAVLYLKLSSPSCPALLCRIHRVAATVLHQTRQPWSGSELAKHSWSQGCVSCGSSVDDCTAKAGSHSPGGCPDSHTLPGFGFLLQCCKKSNAQRQEFLEPWRGKTAGDALLPP